MRSAGEVAKTAVPLRHIVLVALAIFAFNAAICAPLFGIEYLDAFQSNEGAFITFGRFLVRYWPHVTWFPWFDAGIPFENTYQPFIPAAVAIISGLAHVSPAHAFHFLAALGYSAGPAFLFLFAWNLSGDFAASVWAGVLWSLISPSALLLGPPWGARRLMNVVFWGETPHNLALPLLFIALILILRVFERPTIRRLAHAALAAAAVILTNAFGAAVLAIGSVLLVCTRDKFRWRNVWSLLAVLLTAWLAVIRLMTPTLVRLIRQNSQTIGGDFRFSPVRFLLLFAFLILIWALTRRASPVVRFSLLFSACFGVITALGLRDIHLLPQSLRYHVEMEAGICLLLPFAVHPLLRKLPRRAMAWTTALIFFGLAWATVRDYRFARLLIQPTDLSSSLGYREARWLSANLPGQRVFVATDAMWLFNLLTDNPQLGAGHRPSTPNLVRMDVVEGMFLGWNNSEEEGPFSVLWLKAFGCGAVIVAGPASPDYYHPISHSHKFEGLLPMVWSEGGETIYRVPRRSSSLAHVIPRTAAVTRTPANAIDVEPIRSYVAALDDPNAPEAPLEWQNPSHGTIRAHIPPGSEISVQVNYDPGWRARVLGARGAAPREIPVTSDGIGLIIIDPKCVGDCSIDLEFAGGLERSLALLVSLLVTAGLIAAAFRRKGRLRQISLCCPA